jgi:hypothetical protein
VGTCGCAWRGYLGVISSDLSSAISRAISDNRCGVVSISYSFCGESNSFYQNLDESFTRAAAQGQSKERSILVLLFTLISLILVHATAWGQQQAQNQQQDRSEQSQEVLGDRPPPPQPAPLAVPRLNSSLSNA